jgi:hypothetical protein
VCRKARVGPMSETFAKPYTACLGDEDQHPMRLALFQEMQEALPSSIVHGAANLPITMDLIRTSLTSF